MSVAEIAYDRLGYWLREAYYESVNPKELPKDIADLRSVIGVLKTRLDVLEKELRDGCTHPLEELRIMVYHISDTLGNNGYCNYDFRCKVCNKTVFKKEKQ